jgi:hypothetical protein
MSRPRRRLERHQANQKETFDAQRRQDKTGVGKAAEEREFDEEMAELEREMRKEQYAKARKLWELARQIPGPDTPDPKDKIWRYLIAEFGFSPEILWRMTPRDMQRYIDARQSGKEPPGRRKAGDQGQDGEEWLPASEAVKRAEAAGFPITLSRLSKLSERADVRKRPRTLRGNHQLEIEWNSLSGYLLRRASGKQPGGKKTPAEPSDGEFDEEVAKAGKEKQRRRPLD